MPKVTIQKSKDPTSVAHSLFEEVENLISQIRERAYNLFQQRGGSTGAELDDWLRAEREVLWTPPADVIDKGHELQIRLAAPGLEAGEIQVTALPETIVIRAEKKLEREEQEGENLVSEFRSRKLYRRFDLPVPIDPEKMTATLEKGVLRITAPKTDPLQAKTISVSSGG